MKYRRLNQKEIIAAGTLNCTANAVKANIPALSNRLTDEDEKEVQDALDVLSGMVGKIIGQTPDEDERAHLERRITSLQVSLGYVKKPFNMKVMLSEEDANVLLWPVLERCNLDCPCISLDEDGDTVAKVGAVKGCVTRKALVRAGVRGTGKSSLCPYYLTDAMSF